MRNLSWVRVPPLQPFTAQTAKLIFISTTSGTHDKCRVFSTRDEEWRSHFVYTEGFTTQVRVLPRRPGRIVQNSTEQRDICIRNDVEYVTKVREFCLQLISKEAGDYVWVAD